MYVRPLMKACNNVSYSHAVINLHFRLWRDVMKLTMANFMLAIRHRISQEQTMSKPDRHY